MERPRILIVDDDKNFRMQIVWALAEDFELFEATDRESALQYSEEKKEPHIILLDLHLPPKDTSAKEGITLVKAFRRTAPEIKIIIITTDNRRESIAKAKELGADDYIVKPFHIKVLRKAIKEVLSKPPPPGIERRRYWRGNGQEPKGMEKRKYWRVSHKLPISYSSSTFPERRASKTIDISASGVRFSTDYPLPIYSLVDIVISLPKKPQVLIKTTGDVRWTIKLEGEEIYHLGVSFRDIAPEDRKGIANYIYKPGNTG